MSQDYRLIQDPNKLCIGLVTFDKHGNPVKLTTVKTEASTVQDLTHLMIYQMSAFTKPIIEYTVFEPLTIDDDSVKTALAMIRNKHDN